MALRRSRRQRTFFLPFLPLEVSSLRGGLEPLHHEVDEQPYAARAPDNTRSLGEAVQREFPKAPVVKTLDTRWNGRMENPRMLPDTHVNPDCGNDSAPHGRGVCWCRGRASAR
jgi:hypothetical protein